MTKLSMLTITPEIADRFTSEARFGDGRQCVHCGHKKTYALSTRGEFKCAGCLRRFSWTSGSLLAGQKIDDKRLVAAVYAFSAAKKGVSSCELARLIGCQQGAAYYLLQKFRLAVQEIYADVILGGTVEIDGAFFGGHIRHQNAVESGRTRRIGRYHYADRRTVVVLKQRMGKTLTHVGKRESDAREFILERVEPGAVIVVDQAHAWDGLIELYDMLRVNHKYSFAANRVNTNSAESYFAGLRRAQNGTYHQISGKHLGLYAQEVAWRLDHKGSAIEDMMAELLTALLAPLTRIALAPESAVAA